MDGSRKTTNFLLIFIVAILLFGATSIKETLGAIFWVIIIIAVIIFIFYGLGKLIQEQDEVNIKRSKEKEEWEKNNKGWKKTWFGLSYKVEDSKQEKSKKL